VGVFRPTIHSPCPKGNRMQAISRSRDSVAIADSRRSQLCWGAFFTSLNHGPQAGGAAEAPVPSKHLEAKGQRSLRHPPCGPS